MRRKERRVQVDFFYHMVSRRSRVCNVSKVTDGRHLFPWRRRCEAYQTFGKKNFWRVRHPKNVRSQACNRSGFRFFSTYPRPSIKQRATPLPTPYLPTPPPWRYRARCIRGVGHFCPLDFLKTKCLLARSETGFPKPPLGQGTGVGG